MTTNFRLKNSYRVKDVDSSMMKLQSSDNEEQQHYDEYFMKVMTQQL